MHGLIFESEPSLPVAFSIQIFRNLLFISILLCADWRFFSVPSLSGCWLMLISKATFSLILLVLGNPFTRSSPPAYTWPNICFFRRGCITHLKRKHLNHEKLATWHGPENNKIIFLLHCLISVKFFTERIALPLWCSNMTLHHFSLIVMNEKMISVLSCAA